MDDDQYVPGTIHLVDLEGSLNAKHASGSQRDIVLVSSPSSDPDDPLNWSPKRKLLSAACTCAYVVLPCSSRLALPLINLLSYTIAIGIASAAIYSVLTPIEMDTDLTLSDLNAGTGYMVWKLAGSLRRY